MTQSNMTDTDSEADTGSGIETQRYEIKSEGEDGDHMTSCEMKDTPEWTPYEPCPHCGGGQFRGLEVGSTTVFTEDGEIADFAHSEHEDVIEISCEECGETLWRHMAVQLIASKFTYRPF